MLLWQPLSDVAVRITLNVPPEVKICVGFCDPDILLGPEAGSAKFQDQVVMFPLTIKEVLLNVVVFPMQTVLEVKLTAGSGLTMSVCLSESMHPFGLTTTSVTVYVPAAP